MTNLFTWVAIAGQFLAYNPTLEQVALNRQQQPVEVAIHKEIDTGRYECLVGVPYGHKKLIGREVYFISYKYGLQGPWLVVDVEAGHHAGMMAQRDLLADINCKKYVHDKGILVMEIRL